MKRSARRPLPRTRTQVIPLALVAGLLGPALSGLAARAGQEPASRSDLPAPRAFLSCAQDCHADYLRQELSHFDVVRDPYLADLVLVIVHETRLALRDALLRALHAALLDTPHEAAFRIELPARDGETLSGLQDPWDYWVLSPELEASGEGGSGYLLVKGEAELHVRRVTDQHKLRLRLGAGRRWSSYLLEDGTRTSGQVRSWDTRALYAWSLGRHWALGAVASARADDYENLRRTSTAARSSS